MHPCPGFRAAEPGTGGAELRAGGWSRQLWPLAGRGLGLAIHAFVTFASLNGDSRRERMLDLEVERLRRKRLR